MKLRVMLFPIQTLNWKKIKLSDWALSWNENQAVSSGIGILVTDSISNVASHYIIAPHKYVSIKGFNAKKERDKVVEVQDKYEVHTISFQTFFVSAFKIVVDSWKFSMLLLYISWNNWPSFMVSYSKEELQQQSEYTLLKPDCHS